MVIKNTVYTRHQISYLTPPIVRLQNWWSNTGWNDWQQCIPNVHRWSCLNGANIPILRQMVYYAKNIAIFLVWWHFDEIHLESRANFLWENHLQRLHLGFLGGDLIWNTHGTSMYEGLDGVEWNTIVPQVIIDDVLVFQHIYNKKKHKKKIQ